MLVLLLLAASALLGACAFFNQTKFGKHPEGKDLDLIRQSPHYVDGEFRNLTPTPMFTDGSTVFSALLKSLFTVKQNPEPKNAVPSIKTDLRALDREKDLVVWLGHSSYYVQMGGRRILIDPVFSPYASPFSFINRAFEGTNVYSAEDMPDIDYLLISHDHWDHLDYPTVMALEPRVARVICGLGVGTHLRYWGYPAAKVTEADWFAELDVEDGLRIHVLPARHFSGRGLVRNKTLWVGFAIETARRRIFFSGDTGYGPHFARIADMFDGFDLVILENGQYNSRWAYIHMMPEEAAQAAVELRARSLLPAHSGKFSISNHAWNDPFIRIAEASRDKPYRLLTPVIGDPVDFDDEERRYPYWWENME
ncbi:MBL fold metallo-hydrolase [Oxalobacter sp. OttesenSCG-928-P03]|nr:MBL fold metallo-hydrolase [Oxalobacter sp. OttesenSCG-928-P03]